MFLIYFQSSATGDHASNQTKHAVSGGEYRSYVSNHAVCLVRVLAQCYQTVKTLVYGVRTSNCLTAKELTV